MIEARSKLHSTTKPTKQQQSKLKVGTFSYFLLSALRTKTVLHFNLNLAGMILHSMWRTI